MPGHLRLYSECFKLVSDPVKASREYAKPTAQQNHARFGRQSTTVRKQPQSYERQRQAEALPSAVTSKHPPLQSPLLFLHLFKTPDGFFCGRSAFSSPSDSFF
jgi:hypothetical protein